MSWAEHFTSASYSGASYGDGNFSDGFGVGTTGIGPVDVILHEVRRRLVDNAILASIFESSTGAADGARIEVIDGETIDERRTLPRLQIYVGSYDDRQKGGNWNLGTAVITCEILFQPTTGPITPGDATIGSVMSQVALTLRDKHTLQTVVNGMQIDLARNSRPLSWSRVRDLSTDPPMERATVPWEYELYVQENSQRLYNIVTAE